VSSGDYFQRVSSDYWRYSRWSSSAVLLSVELDRLLEFGGDNFTVVDLGAGNCAYLESAAASKVYPFGHLLAIDNSRMMLQSKISPGGTVKKVQADAHFLPVLDHVADRVLGRQILHYVDLYRVLREIKRILRPSGLFHSTQQVDYSGVPEEWYERWSALRDAATRRRLSDELLTKATLDTGFLEIDRVDVPLRLDYTWEDLALKYGRESNDPIMRRFFCSIKDEIRDQFDMTVDSVGVAYTSRFRVSTFAHDFH